MKCITPRLRYALLVANERNTSVTQIETSTSNGQPAKVEAPKIPVLSLDEGYAYFDGRIVPMSEAKVSIATHALNYGTACFEGIRGYWNANHEQLYLLKLREHYERMANSWNVLRMKPQESIDDLCRITVELVRKHELTRKAATLPKWPFRRRNE